MAGLPVIAADLALGKLVYEMTLHRCAYHFSVSARNLVEKSAPFHFRETEFAARRRITLTIATATITAAGISPLRVQIVSAIADGKADPAFDAEIGPSVTRAGAARSSQI
jgi:hypothetical protein